MTQIDEPNLDEQIDKALEELVFCGRDNIGVTDEAVLARKAIKALIANQIQEAYRKGYNDNARDCYCDSTKLIESLIPHKHLMDDGKSHDIRPDLPKGDDK